MKKTQKNLIQKIIDDGNKYLILINCGQIHYLNYIINNIAH